MGVLRQLDELIDQARKLSDRSRTTVTGQLEDLRNRARYCLEQVGPLGQDALREISRMRFHPPPDNLDQDEAEQARLYRDFDSMIALLEGVKNRIETKGLAPHAAIAPFPTPPNSGWRDLSIRFLSDHRVELCIGDQVETRNYSELGFEDRRNGTPTSAWVLLRTLAEQGGTIPKPERAGAAQWTKVEKRVQEIRRTFQEVFRIAGDPFEPFKEAGGYKARFRMSCATSFKS